MAPTNDPVRHANQRKKNIARRTKLIYWHCLGHRSQTLSSQWNVQAIRYCRAFVSRSLCVCVCRAFKPQAVQTYVKFHFHFLFVYFGNNNNLHSCSSIRFNWKGSARLETNQVENYDNEILCCFADKWTCQQYIVGVVRHCLTYIISVKIELAIARKLQFIFLSSVDSSLHVSKFLAGTTATTIKSKTP